MDRREVKIAKWLFASGIDLEEASVITDFPEKKLRELRVRLDRDAGRAFLPPELDIVIGALGANKKLTFVQVGANDGKSGDPIYKLVMKYGARALLIEPQPWLMEKLYSNYQGFSGKFAVENIAIGPGGETLDLHVLKSEHWDDYIERVGRHPSSIFSPDRAQVLKRIAPRLDLSQQQAEHVIEKISVPMEPLSDVIARHDFDEVDVLQIDCEGWDYKVIQTLGLYRPSVINFESCNLSRADWEGFQRWSDAEDYGWIKRRADTVAIRGFPHRLTL